EPGRRPQDPRARGRARRAARSARCARGRAGPSTRGSPGSRARRPPQLPPRPRAGQPCGDASPAPLTLPSAVPLNGADQVKCALRLARITKWWRARREVVTLTPNFIHDICTGRSEVIMGRFWQGRASKLVAVLALTAA